MGAPDRLTRVNEVLKREIADYLERDSALKDGDGLTSVTGVSVAPNLRRATVAISVMGSDDTKHAVLKYLRTNRSAIQKQVSKDVVLKYTPVLEFTLDDKTELGDKVLDIIREMEQDAGEDQ